MVEEHGEIGEAPDRESLEKQCAKKVTYESKTGIIQFSMRFDTQGSLANELVIPPFQLYS